MNYKVGDTVVCIDSLVPSYCWESGLIVGKKYAVRAIHGPKCIELIGETEDDSGKPSLCVDCGILNLCAHFESFRFIKLDGLKVENEEEATA
jgi:hypothetical protein